MVVHLSEGLRTLAFHFGVVGLGEGVAGTAAARERDVGPDCAAVERLNGPEHGNGCHC